MSYDLMVEENYRINNEFYADSLPIFMNKLGKKSVIFDVDLCILWGRPAELYAYDQQEYQRSRCCFPHSMLQADR